MVSSISISSHKPVKTEDGYELKKGGPGKVDLLFADSIVKPGYFLIGNWPTDLSRRSYLANHAARTVTVVKPLGLSGGGNDEEVLRALTSASLAVVSQSSPQALFGVIFLQSLTESTGRGVEDLGRYLSDALQSVTQKICDGLEREFTKQTMRAILEKNLLAQTKILEYAKTGDPRYLDAALQAADETYAKVVLLGGPQSIRVQELFSAIQAIRFDVHLARGLQGSLGEFDICEAIASDSLKWLEKGDSWDFDLVKERFEGEAKVVVSGRPQPGPGLFSPRVTDRSNGHEIILDKVRGRDEAMKRIDQWIEETARKICADTSDRDKNALISLWKGLNAEIEKRPR